MPRQPISVTAGATLEGSSALGGAIAIAGTYSPGDGPGFQQITGELVFQTGSIFRCDILSASEADRIDATSVAMDPGVGISIAMDHPESTVDFSATSWSQPIQWTILNAASLTGAPVLGTLSRDSGGRPAAPFGTFSLTTGATGIVLHWTPSGPWPRWLYASFGEAWNDPLVAAPGADPDGDGQDNHAEWIFGTVPGNQASRFQPEWTGGSLVIHRAHGRGYRVETTNTLDGQWTIHTNVPSGSGPITIPCPQGTEKKRFFRVAAFMDD